MQTLPLVSVIIPNFNHAGFLLQRIESVLQQHYQYIELILLDDHSSDNSIEIIEAYRNHPLVSHVVINDRNSGSTFRQWEKGFGLARGEYIWIAESDDLADPYFLDDTVSRALSSGAGIVYTDSYNIDGKGARNGRWSEVMERYGPENRWVSDFTVPGLDLLAGLHAITNNIPNASCALIRKSVVREEYFEQVRDFRYAGDWLFWGLCFRDCTVSYIHKPLNFFRTHANTTRSASAKKKEYLAEYYACTAAFQPFLAERMTRLFEQNLAVFFEKWHFGSIKYFLKNFSWKRLRAARQVDPAIDRRIARFFLSVPLMAVRRLRK